MSDTKFRRVYLVVKTKKEQRLKDDPIVGVYQSGGKGTEGRGEKKTGSVRKKPGQRLKGGEQKNSCDRIQRVRDVSKQNPLGEARRWKSSSATPISYFV